MDDTIAYHPSLAPGVSAVTLVAHGLNLLPEAMLPLVHWLNAQGSDVYLLKLSGHTAEGIAMKQVTASLWEREMFMGYERARQASLRKAVPLYFLGYSLGALLGQSMIALNQSDAFDRQVLLAPAIALRRRSYPVKMLSFLRTPLSLPSYTPKAYRANSSLPLSVYAILFSEEEKIRRAAYRGLNLPTLVLMDPKDELVSYRRLLRRVGCFGLTQYRVVTLNHQMKDRSEAYHHLVISEQTMGQENWQLATSEIKRFLFP